MHTGHIENGRWTWHATQQAQRRGISSDKEIILDQYGRREPAPGGGEIVVLDRREKKEIEAEYGKGFAADLSRGAGLYKFETAGMVITIGHRYRRIKRR